MLLIFFGVIGYLAQRLTSLEASSARLIQSPPEVVPTKVPISAEIIWNQVNEWRISQGKKAYILDENICKVAQERADEITKDFGHQLFMSHINELKKFAYVGENLAGELKTNEDAMWGWLLSPEHHKTLEDNRYTHSCIRCTDNDCAQIFGYY